MTADFAAHWNGHNCTIQRNVRDKSLVIKGKVETREGTGNFDGKGMLAEEIMSFESARDRFIRNVMVTVKSQAMDEAIYTRLKDVFLRHPGICRVNLLLNSQENGPILIETKTGIKPSAPFIGDVEKILGPESWSFGKFAKTH